MPTKTKKVTDVPTADKAKVKAAMRLDGYSRFDEIAQGAGLWTIVGYKDQSVAAGPRGLG